MYVYFEDGKDIGAFASIVFSFRKISEKKCSGRLDILNNRKRRNSTKSTNLHAESRIRLTFFTN